LRRAAAVMRENVKTRGVRYIQYARQQARHATSIAAYDDGARDRDDEREVDPRNVLTL